MFARAPSSQNHKIFGIYMTYDDVREKARPLIARILAMDFPSIDEQRRTMALTRSRNFDMDGVQGNTVFMAWMDEVAAQSKRPVATRRNGTLTSRSDPDLFGN